jgi:glucokinase
MKPPCYIGIDIGATWIKAGIVSREGKLLKKSQFAASQLRSPSHFLSMSKDTIAQLLAENDFRKEHLGGIGVGAPGWVDHPKGIVRELTNIPGWHDIPLVAQLEQLSGLKSFVDNDANVMAVGEMVYGAGRGRKNFVCLTLGTGVGGAIVVNGEVYRGNDGLAGEIGHMTLDLNGPLCACGARGCLERYVGNRYIVENALRRLHGPSPRESIILDLADGKPELVTPRLLSEAAAKGDALARQVWTETGEKLGAALAVLVNLLNPECFIIGGGVAKAGAVLFDPMRTTLGKLAMNRIGESTPILEAQLREEAGIIGAATFAMNCLEKTS